VASVPGSPGPRGSAGACSSGGPCPPGGAGPGLFGRAPGECPLVEPGFRSAVWEALSMDIIIFLEELHDRCLEISKQLRFDKHHKLHFALVSLYGSLIELVGCMLILIRNNAKLGVPSLSRTFLETYVEFHNLVRDPKYGYYMEATYLKEWLRILKVAKDGKNLYLIDISDLPDLHSIIIEQEKLLKELEKLGYKPLNIYEKFKRAEMIEEYQSIYNFLCTESHSNKRALISRHADIADDDFNLVFYKNDPIERYFQYLDPSAGLLVSATIDIHDYFESPAIDQARDLYQQLKKVRSKY
jgi:hypothetical protein